MFKKYIILIIVILVSKSLFSQIRNCSECDTKIYSYQDISHLSLLELKIFRNEIFARHQYVFKDDRLTNYFLENYTWYSPNNNSENKMELNSIEKQNISLLLKYENKKETLKETIIQELKKLKQAILKDDTVTITQIIKNVVDTNQNEYFNSIKNDLKDVLSVINLEGINWYNEKGLFKITIDDGHFLSEKSIAINKNKIILLIADTGYSELLNDESAFKFGSDFDSVNEYSSWYTFKIINNKLVLIEHQAAG